MSRRRVDALVAEALDSPRFRRAYLRFSREKATRPVRSCRCTVLEVPDSATDRDFALLTPGTVSAFVAREGEPLLDDLVAALAAHDGAAFDRITARVRRTVAELPRGAPATGPYPTIAELTYAGKPLVSLLHAGDVLQVTPHAFVHNGGHLDPASFAVHEYHPPDSRTPLACVLVVRRPVLGEIEREALRLVPGDATANNLGAAPVGPVTPALVAFVAMAAEAAARFVHDEFVNWFVAFLHGGTTTALASLPDAVLRGDEFQEVLRTLPPEVTAAELVRLRTDMLLDTPPG